MQDIITQSKITTYVLYNGKLSNKLFESTKFSYKFMYSSNTLVAQL